MKEVFKEEKTPLIIIFGLFLLTFVLMWGHCGNLILDCGREAYIPYAIGQGKVLYKDIFCIYGAFPYLFNAFSFKIFSSNLAVLYIIGGFLSASYLLGVYLCSREFLSKTISTSVTLLVMFAAVFDNTIFNFIFPYSYAMVFACVFSIWMLFCLIKFIHTKNPKFLHIAAFLWGAICMSKIDFIPVIIPFSAVFWLFEKNKKQELIKCIFYALIIPFITYLVLFAQGVTFTDFSKNAYYLSLMLKSESLKTFYTNYNLIFFNKWYFLKDFINLISTVFISTIFFIVTLYAIRKRKKIIKFGLSAFTFVFCFAILFLQQTPIIRIFALLPYICTIIFIWLLFKYFRSKDYRNVRLTSILTLFAFAIVCSLKNYNSLVLGFYGTYSFAPLIISFVWFIKDILENNVLYNTKRQYETVLSIFIIVVTLIYAYNLAIRASVEQIKIKTPSGMQKTTAQVGKPYAELIEYFKNHLKNGESISVLPEGIMINFLTQGVWDSYQTSFIPLDFDTFGEHNIVKEFKKNNPQYVIFLSRDTSEYGKSLICRDYAAALCKNIFVNYDLEAVFGEKFRIYLFKSKGNNENKG